MLNSRRVVSVELTGALDVRRNNPSKIAPIEAGTNVCSALLWPIHRYTSSSSRVEVMEGHGVPAGTMLPPYLVTLRIHQSIACHYHSIRADRCNASNAWLRRVLVIVSGALPGPFTGLTLRSCTLKSAISPHTFSSLSATLRF